MPAALIYALSDDQQRAKLNRAQADRRTSRLRARAGRRSRGGASPWPA